MSALKMRSITVTLSSGEKVKVSFSPNQDFAIHKGKDGYRVRIFDDGRVVPFDLPGTREPTTMTTPAWIWCTECQTQLPKGDVKAIRQHYLEKHRIDPGHEQLKTILGNTTPPDGLYPTGIVHPTPTDGITQINDGDIKGRTPGEAQAGAFGMKR